MNVKVNFGNFVLDITAVNEDNGYIRIKKLYIDKISNMYDGMLLSEWVTKEQINEIVRSHMIDTKEANGDEEIIYSRQPRKRLRRFNIL